MLEDGGLRTNSAGDFPTSGFPGSGASVLPDDREVTSGKVIARAYMDEASNAHLRQMRASPTNES